MTDFDKRLEMLSPERRALLETLLKEKRKAAAAPRPAISRRKEAGTAPLSYAQERMWFLDLLQPGSAFYNMYQAVELSGPLSTSALSDALLELKRRHESLRTTFREGNDGLPAQAVAPAPQRDDLPLVDLSGLPEPLRRRVADALARREAHRPFDLGRGPLLRATLFKLGEEEHVLLLAMHHIVSDGWSIGVLFSEISSLYATYAGGQPSPLGEPELQYADYAGWQREWLRGEALERQLSYWRGKLAAE